MRHYIDKMIPTKMTKVLDKITCDLCGKEALHGDWEGATYGINETEIKVTVKQKEGQTYPEDGYGTACEVDMCPKCFKTKLIPWLSSIGCTVKIKEWSY